MQVGEVGALRIDIVEQLSDVRFQGNIPDEIILQYPEDMIDVLPSQAIHTSALTQMSVVAKKEGQGVIRVLFGSGEQAQEMARIPVRVAREIVRNNWSASWLEVADGSFAVGYLQDQNQKKMIKTPFDDELTIAVESGRGCLIGMGVNGLQVGECLGEGESVSLGYEETIQGLVIWQWQQKGEVSMWYQGREVR